MLHRLLDNHILSNLAFVLVLVMGWLAYQQLPRQQDPTINFNWIYIEARLPGASASDVEKRVTNVLEEAIDRVGDVKWVSSTSRESISTVLVRFEDVEDRIYDRRLNDLRREIQNKGGELPVAAANPTILEITSTNTFPSAMVLVVGAADDESLRRESQRVEEDLERFDSIDRVDGIGMREPELQVLFEPSRLVGPGVSPSTIADTVTAYFRDLAAGSLGQGEQQWLVRLIGTNSDPSYLAGLPVLSTAGEIPLRSVATVLRGRADAAQMVRYRDQPAVLLAVFKKADTNVLDLIESINRYIGHRNELIAGAGISLVLLDDQTETTRQALRVMERNAMLGLALVVGMVWLFLGFKIALLACVGIPFILAGVFWFLLSVGQTLNVVVLLGVVISLGMLVDDSVVVVEAIYYHLSRGLSAAAAAVAALREIVAPVTTAVLTTIAAFLPLMLMPGILGKFMLVAPLVVTAALIISLIEAYWILPSHVIWARVQINPYSRVQRLRERATAGIRRQYSRMLLRALRYPRLTSLAGGVLLAGCAGALASGLIRVEFFANDVAPIFYINVEMPAGTSLAKTIEVTQSVERMASRSVRPGEARATASYAGQVFTDREPLNGDNYGQVAVSLTPRDETSRSVDQIIDGMRQDIATVPGPIAVSFVRRIAGAPPTAKPVSIKVRGDDEEQVRAAADRVIGILKGLGAVSDITDNDVQGRAELAVRLNPDAVMRARLSPTTVVRDVGLLVDGEIVASMQDQGEKLEVRVRARPGYAEEIGGFLRTPIALADGSAVSLGQLVDHEVILGKDNIKHYNLRRAITIEAEIDKRETDTVAVNRLIQKAWAEQFAERFPDIDLDFSGELDDITESLEAMLTLFLLGLGLIYLILGTQFKSYVQPLIILATVPMAFTGVALGLLVTGHPFSLYTLYGVVALAGIAVNSAIVLISAANERLRGGMTVAQATVFAGRRRVVPVLITSLTTIAGLSSLAAGLGGHSLVWGPLATSIVWGLATSTLLTLFMIPVFYSATARPPEESKALPAPVPLAGRSGGPLGRLLTGGWMTRHAAGTEQAAIDAIVERDDVRELYNIGARMLAEKRYEQAVRAFEQATRLLPDNGLLHLYSAQSLILFAETLGWDEGYVNRARRYLAQAKKLLPESGRLLMVERAYRAIPTTG